MKKYILFTLCLLLFQMTYAQKYYTKTGSLSFEASVPAFEPVKAKNETSTALLDLSNGKVAVLALIKGFRFKNALMEEHFNENYMDSDTYSKATFNGTIQDFSSETLDAQKEYKLVGDLSIHGEKKTVNTAATLERVGEKIVLKCTFSVAPSDFNIEIPKIVKDKISNEIIITSYFELKPR